MIFNLPFNGILLEHTKGLNDIPYTEAQVLRSSEAFQHGPSLVGVWFFKIAAGA